MEFDGKRVLVTGSTRGIGRALAAYFLESGALGWQGFNRAEDPQAAYDAFAAGSKLKRLPTNDDVIAAFAFLASDGAGFMTGVALPVDGGKSAGA